MRVLAVCGVQRIVRESAPGALRRDEREGLAWTEEIQRLPDVGGSCREVRPDCDDDHRRPAMVTPEVAHHLQRVAHEASLARVDLEPLPRDLVGGAEEHRVADGKRRGIEPLSLPRGLQVDAAAAGLRGSWGRCQQNEGDRCATKHWQGTRRYRVTRRRR
jgi:hypothetical protein